MIYPARTRNAAAKPESLSQWIQTFRQKVRKLAKEIAYG